VVKLLKDFRPVKVIARGEVSKKRKYGNVSQIDSLFKYITSADDGGSHLFRTRKLAKKYPAKQEQPVFIKSLPEKGSDEYIQLVNNLTRIGLTFGDYYDPDPSNKEAVKIEKDIKLIERRLSWRVKKKDRSAAHMIHDILDQLLFKGLLKDNNKWFESVKDYGLSKVPATDARFPTSCPIATPLSNTLLNLAAACSPTAPKFAPIADDSP
jgi:hypothetical protein